MARITQSVFTEEVLDRTIHLFWQKGFSNTSIEDIIQTTGFNRAAIYKHFGGKHGLFLEMLKRYRNQITAQLISPFSFFAHDCQVIRVEGPSI